jgi:hypothetical protein
MSINLVLFLPGKTSTLYEIKAKKSENSGFFYIITIKSVSWLRLNKCETFMRECLEKKDKSDRF